MIVKVALAVPPYYMLDYKVDINSEVVKLFDRVLVSVGKRKLIGFIIAKNVAIDYDVKKVKPIIKKLDVVNPDDFCKKTCHSGYWIQSSTGFDPESPSRTQEILNQVQDDSIGTQYSQIDYKPISSEIAKLITWLSNYYCCDLYSAIRLALPNDFFKEEYIKPQQDVFVYVDSGSLATAKLTAKQQALVDSLDLNGAIKLEDLKQLGSTHIINKLFEKEILKKTYELKQNQIIANPDIPRKLNTEQRLALDSILANRGFNVSLLYGVTGSGKTEVYLQAIKEFLEDSKQILVLVPEINLTPQTIKRFERRFADKQIVALHSKLSEKARLTNWLKIKQGKADIVISTRSGVLADFKNLGIIIVDEEHDSSFKQQTSTIRYNARDVAIFRASQLGIPVVLGSATPSIQSYYNATVGKYKLLKLTQRALNTHKNQIELLDLKTSVVDNSISDKLFTLLEQNINAHGQSLIFINKLGFAKALVCNSCGAVEECKKCDKPYTLHTHPYQYLECHFCGSRKPIVTACSSCGEQDLFAYGTGTEKIQSRIEAKFPYNKIVRFDRANIKTMSDLHSINQMINDGLVDVVVGTQMIAKGHHFENITLAGLINIDAGLYSTDFHAIERTAQMIVQVSGRAGRADKPGRIILQTYQPENKLLQTLVSKDYLEFLDYLLEQRKYAAYPPYSYQAQIIAESTKENEILSLLNELYSKLYVYENIQISKPLPALHLKRNNVYRYSLLLTAKTRSELNSIIKWVANSLCQNLPNSIKVYFDIDPIELV